MAKRKALSKKVRFEVFKLDSFTCQYCGRTPPSVVLEVDHVTPVSLGGDNSIENLVTSCFDCNRGKGATELSVLPKTLAEKASVIKEREAQLHAYNELLKKRAERIEDDTWEVVSALECNAKIDSYNRQRLLSVKKFLNRLPAVEVIDAAEITAAKFGRIGTSAFAYFCGICWSKIREAENG